MKISHEPTDHIMVKANTTSEWDCCDFALIPCGDGWKEVMGKRLTAVESFDAPDGFISIKFYDGSPDFYQSQNEEAELLPEGTDWAFVTLEEGEAESFTEPESRLESASLFLYKDGTGYYRTYGKHTNEEFYTAELPLAKILERLNAYD